MVQSIAKSAQNLVALTLDLSGGALKKTSLNPSIDKPLIIFRQWPSLAASSSGCLPDFSFTIEAIQGSPIRNVELWMAAFSGLSNRRLHVFNRSNASTSINFR